MFVNKIIAAISSQYNVNTLSSFG